jgi:monothiol glutaredoxin
VGGELVGGCDIIMDMYRSGQLKELVDGAAVDADDNA